MIRTRNGRFLWLATAVLLLAAVCRIVWLQQVPPGLAQDEVLNADIVQMIRAGEHALFFREGYGHEPLYHYWSVPFQWALGDNWLAIRLPALFIGMLVVAASMRWARRDFGTVAAIAAGGLMAVVWWPIIFSRIGIRPMMQPLFWIAAIWFWQKRPFLAGVLLGLSLYTYTGAQLSFALPVLYGLGQLILARDGAARKTAVRQSGIIFVTTFLIGLPLYLTWRADPTLLQRVDQLAGPLDALREGNISPVLQATWLNIAAFVFTGDARSTYMLQERSLFGWLTAIFFYGGAVVALWRVRQPKYTLLLALLVAGLLPSILTPQTPSTNRMVGAIPAVFVLIGLAVDFVGQHWPKPRQKTAVVTGVLLVLMAGSLFRTVQDGRAWTESVETRVKHYQTFLSHVVDYLRQHPTERIVIADSFFEQIDADSLHRTLGYDEQARWVNADPDLGGAMVIPAGEGNGRLFIPEFASVHPDLLKAANIPLDRMEPYDTVPEFAVVPLPDIVQFPETDTPILFEDKIQLEGHLLIYPSEDEPLTLITFWRVRQPLPWNLTAFVHLLDAKGNLVAQHDGFDAAPVQLQPGDVIIQRHPLTVPADTVPPFSLQIGLYLPDSGVRLLIAGESLDVHLLESNFTFDGK